VIPHSITLRRLPRLAQDSTLLPATRAAIARSGKATAFLRRSPSRCEYRQNIRRLHSARLHPTRHRCLSPGPQRPPCPPRDNATAPLRPLPLCAPDRCSVINLVTGSVMATARCKRQNAATEVTAEWWGGAVLLERPRPNLRVPALNASGAGRGSPGLRCTGHRAVGSGGHRTNVDGGGRSGSDGATGAALHSVRSAMVLAVELCPGERGALAGIVVPPGSALRACSPDPGELLVWPVTREHLGRGRAQTSVESPAT
jgi:hypothetical protein